MPYESPNIVIVPTKYFVQNDTVVLMDSPQKKKESDKMGPSSRTNSNVSEPSVNTLEPALNIVGSERNTIIKLNTIQRRSATMNMPERDKRKLNFDDEKNIYPENISKALKVSQSKNLNKHIKPSESLENKFTVNYKNTKPIKLNLSSSRENNTKKNTPQNKSDQLRTKLLSDSKCDTDGKNPPTAVTKHMDAKIWQQTNTVLRPNKDIIKKTTKNIHSKAETDQTNKRSLSINTPRKEPIVTKLTQAPHQDINNCCNEITSMNKVGSHTIITSHSTPSTSFVPSIDMLTQNSTHSNSCMDTWMCHPVSYPNTYHYVNATNNDNIQSNLFNNHPTLSQNLSPYTIYTPHVDTVNWLNTMPHINTEYLTNNIQQDLHFSMTTAGLGSRMDTARCMQCEVEGQANVFANSDSRVPSYKEATNDMCNHNNITNTSQLPTIHKTPLLNNACVCPNPINKSTAYINKEILVKDSFRFEKQILPTSQTRHSDPIKSKISDNSVNRENLKERSKKRTPISSLTQEKELKSKKSYACLDKPNAESSESKRIKEGLEIQKELYKIETRIKNLVYDKHRKKTHEPFESEKSTLLNKLPKKAKAYENMHDKKKKKMNNMRDKNEKRVYDDLEDESDIDSKDRHANRSERQKKQSSQRLQSGPRCSHSAEQTQMKRVHRNSCQSHECPPPKRIRQNSDNNTIKKKSPVISYVHRADKEQIKYPRVQAPKNDSDNEQEFNFDLRTKLNRTNNQHCSNMNRSIYGPQNKKIIDKPSQIKISVSKNNESGNNKSPPHRLTPKTKTIKLVINVTCANQKDSSEDSSFSSDDSSSGDLRNLDLSFLDDFNIDEIVNSLKHSPKRDHIQQDIPSDIDKAKYSANALIKDFVQPIIIKREIKTEHLHTDEQSDFTHKKSNCQASPENVCKNRSLNSNTIKLRDNIVTEVNTITAEKAGILMQTIKQEPDSKIETHVQKTDVTSDFTHKDITCQASTKNVYINTHGDIIQPATPNSNKVNKLQDNTATEVNTITAVKTSIIIQNIKQERDSDIEHLEQKIDVRSDFYHTQTADSDVHKTVIEFINPESVNIDSSIDNSYQLKKTVNDIKLGPNKNNKITLKGSLEALSVMDKETILNVNNNRTCDPGVLTKFLESNIMCVTSESENKSQEKKDTQPSYVNKIEIVKENANGDVNLTDIDLNKKGLTDVQDPLHKTPGCTAIDITPIKTAKNTTEPMNEFLSAIPINDIQKAVSITTHKTLIKTSEDIAEIKTLNKPAGCTPIDIAPVKTAENTTEPMKKFLSVVPINDTQKVVGITKHKILINTEDITEVKTLNETAGCTAIDIVPVKTGENMTETMKKSLSVIPKNDIQNTNLLNQTTRNDRTILTEPNKDIVKKIEETLVDRLQRDFSVLSLICNGRYSKTFKCQCKNGHYYAVKVLNNELNCHSLAIKKVNMIEKFQKDMPKENLNTVYFMSGFALGKKWCFLMEYYPKSLEQALHKEVFHIDEVQELGKQLVSAVMMLRNNNIVHSDITPAHILLDACNKKIKLCGFDDAYYAGTETLRPNIGSVNYRAPEIILGYSAKFTIDVWSTALVMYEMTSGMKMFQGKYNNEILYKQMCLLGSLPFEMLSKSIFTWNHFRNNVFMLRRGFRGHQSIFIPNFYKTNKLHGFLLGSYYQHWGVFRTYSQRRNDMTNLNSFYTLLEQMLVLDPRRRLTIEHAYLHPFLRV